MLGFALALPLLGLAFGMVGAEEGSEAPSEGDDFIDETAAKASLNLDALGGDDTIVGGREGDFIVAGAGDDTVIGGGGEDRIEGGDGNDFLSGNTLGDTYGAVKDDGAADVLIGGKGDDTLIGYGEETLNGGEGNDSLHVIHDMNNTKVPVIEGLNPQEDTIVVYLKGIDEDFDVEVSAEDTADGIALVLDVDGQRAVINVSGDDLHTDGLDFSFLKLKVEEDVKAA